jgi:glycosyltransferase involved in cell wall biosynthesis
MECGTLVISSNVSVMQEVAGDAALLVDPNNPKEIAKKMFREKYADINKPEKD